MLNDNIDADEALLLALNGQTPADLAAAYALVEASRPDIPSGITVPSVPASCSAMIQADKMTLMNLETELE